MSEQGSNKTLVCKKLKAVQIGIDSLKSIWYGKEFHYGEVHVKTSIKVLQSLLLLFPSIEKQIAKAKDMSPQKTLNKRRLAAIQMAI